MLGVSSAVVAEATAAVGGQLQSRAVSGPVWIHHLYLRLYSINRVKEAAVTVEH